MAQLMVIENKHSPLLASSLLHGLMLFVLLYSFPVFMYDQIETQGISFEVLPIAKVSNIPTKQQSSLPIKPESKKTYNSPEPKPERVSRMMEKDRDYCRDDR